MMKYAILILSISAIFTSIACAQDDQNATQGNQPKVIYTLSGTGTLVHGGRRDAFGPGDVFFVPAGQAHRFVDFSADFATWVVFYGTEGGEQP